ncbi:hypothetical protein IPdc08_00430 [archaeon]|nr:hypothetical protein IPdc08_00430 [archaeon]
MIYLYTEIQSNLLENRMNISIVNEINKIF